jgi:polyhydroxybutyrate depolymerase
LKLVPFIRLGVALAVAAALVVVVLAHTGSSSAPASADSCRPGDRTLSVSIDGAPHEAVLHVPRGAQGRVPLVIAFHGAYDTARSTSVSYGLSQLADREHFAVLYPQATHDRFWELRPDQHEDVDALRVLLDRVERASCIDRSRVYATGVSNGGGFTARLGCEMADRLAAIAPVAGGYAPLGRCRPYRPMPVLEIHGTKDDVVPYGGTGPDHSGSVSRFLAQWTALDGCRGGPKRTTPRPGVTRLTWDRCAGGTVVEHLRLADTDHGWPGSHWAEAGKKTPSPPHDPTGLDTAETVWDFLSRFRLPSPLPPAERSPSRSGGA